MSIFPTQYSTLSAAALGPHLSEVYALPGLSGRYLLRGVSDTYLFENETAQYILKSTAKLTAPAPKSRARWSY